jgi:alanine dehydrogenase
MRFLSADDILKSLSFKQLIPALKSGFRSEITIPARHHHSVKNDGTLLLMPAFNDDYIGTKIVSVFPHNASLNIPAVQGSYFLQNGKTGEALAVIEGKTLTALRTAAASALASSYLSRENSKTLLMIGAGALAEQLIKAHSEVRPIEKILLWNRTNENAVKLKGKLNTYPIEIVNNLDEAFIKADIISSATISSTPLIKGQYIKSGTHIDLVGGFTPKMREADDAAITKATLYCDTFAGGLSEAGDLVEPITRGIISKTDVQGDLFSLCKNNKSARANQEEITLFKSVGTALEDLIAAITIYTLLEQKL